MVLQNSLKTRAHPFVPISQIYFYHESDNFPHCALHRVRVVILLLRAPSAKLYDGRSTLAGLTCKCPNSAKTGACCKSNGYPRQDLDAVWPRQVAVGVNQCLIPSTANTSHSAILARPRRRILPRSSRSAAVQSRTACRLELR